MIAQAVFTVGWTLIHFAWQGTAIALLAALGLQVSAASSARWRYGLATVALGSMVVASLTTAAWLWTSSGADGWTDESAVAAAVGEGQAVSSLENMPPVELPGELSSEAGAPVLVGLSEMVLPAIVILWLVGVTVLVGRMAGGLWYVGRLQRSALRWEPSAWQQPARRLAERLHLRVPVHVVDSLRVDVPTVVGWLRPVILLPAAALANMSPAQVEAILVHELAHVRRHDYLVNAMQTAAETLLFFHPGVWWVSARIRSEREYCCDDIAVEISGDALGYARALAELEAVRVGHAGFAIAASGGSLVERVRRILREPARLGHDDPRVAAWAATLVLTVLAAGLAAAIQRPAPPAPSPAAVAMPQVSAPPSVPEPRTAPEPQGLGAPPSNVQRRTSWRDGFHHVEASLQGEVAFTDDLTDISRLSPGGRLTIRDWHYLIPYTIDVHEADGALERAYYIAGIRQTWDAGARTMLAEHVGRLTRRSGFGARARVARVLVTGGVNGVLAELARLETDRARRAYVNELIAQSDARGSLLAAIFDFSGGAVSSSYELSALLRHAAARAVLDETSGAAYLRAADQVRSDYERRRTLTALVAADGFGASLAQNVLRSAGAIRSGYEKGATIRALADLAATDPGVGQAYLDAADTIRSDYERRRALTALVAADGADAVLARQVARSASLIRSDSEKVVALRALAPLAAADEAAARAYVEAAGSIHTDYERRRALQALAATRGADDSVAGLVAEAAAGIRSGQERGRALRAALAAAPDASALPGDALLLAARGISSDTERSRLLIQFVEAGRLDADAGAAFFAALRSVRATTARRRVLATVMARDRIPDGLMIPLLDAVRATNSDNARAALLVALVEGHDLTAADRDAFLRAAASIRSSRGENRVLTAYVRADLR